MQDLVLDGRDKKRRSILKITNDVGNHGERTCVPMLVASTSGSPKLSHHFDGRAQISGPGVSSGYVDGEPKGVAIQSFGLNETNDGGPVFSFLVWGVENLGRKANPEDLHLELDYSHVLPAAAGRELNAFAVEGFYILKNSLPQDFDYSRKLIYQSGVSEKMELTVLPSPIGTPGVVGFIASRTWHGFKTDVGFTMNGAPGRVYGGHYSDSLVVAYPRVSCGSQEKDLDYAVRAP